MTYKFFDKMSRDMSKDAVTETRFFSDPVFKNQQLAIELQLLTT